MTKGKKPARATARTKRRDNAPTAALTVREERFVHEYLADPDHNASAAYVRAGYNCANANTAKASASRLLRKPAIKKAIDEVRAADAARYAVTRERVLAEYAKLAFTDPRRFYREDGSLKHPTELDDATAAAMVQFEVEEEYIGDEPDTEMEQQPHGGALKRQQAKTLAIGRIAKVKWSDKKAALDSIVKLMGWAKETGPGSSPENPVHMIVEELQGRRSALMPRIASDEEGEE